MGKEKKEGLCGSTYVNCLNLTKGCINGYFFLFNFLLKFFVELKFFFQTNFERVVGCCKPHTLMLLPDVGL